MHIVIDARIRRASTGRPVAKLLEQLPGLESDFRYSVLLSPGDDWQPPNRRFKALACKYPIFSLNPWQQISYARFLSRLSPSLVFFTLTGQQPLFYFGRQITFTHDLTMFKYARRGRLPRWLHFLRLKGYRLLVWQAHRKAVRILVPSQYVRDAVARFHLFSSRKLVVVPEAAEAASTEPPSRPASLPAMFDLADRNAGDENAAISFILYVGSAFPHKNLRRLVEAFGQLAADRPKLCLVLAGRQEKYYRRLKRRAAASPAGERIFFTNFVSESELNWLYQRAAAYVFPSLSEGFGLPGLEAMTHGCPVVSSNATCLPEIYGPAAHYFDPLDVADMAAKIGQVLSDRRLRARLVTGGQQRVALYSWRRFARQTLAVMKEVL